MAVGGPKIFKSIHKFSMPTTYVDNHHPLLISIPQELGKLSNSLAAQAKEVGFFKLAQKCSGHQNWRLSHQERIHQTHTSTTQRSTAYWSTFHKEWPRRRKKRHSAMGLTPLPLRSRSSSTQSWTSRCKQGKCKFSFWKRTTTYKTCGSPQSR